MWQRKSLKTNLLKLRKQQVGIEDLTTRITLAVSNVQTDKPIVRKRGERAGNPRKVVSREIMCFKVIKLFYKLSIYT